MANALLVDGEPDAEGEVEIQYTLPSLHDTSDDAQYFRRMEAIRAFPRAALEGDV